MPVLYAFSGRGTAAEARDVTLPLLKVVRY